MLEIRPSSVKEIFGSPNIKELLDDYAAESSIGGLPHPKAKIDLYEILEANGAIYVIGAFFDDILIGFIFIVSPIIPHYSAKISTSESFFVSSEYRKTGAGLKLLKSAEEYAKSIESLGLLVSSPIGSKFAEVLSGTEYTETNRVFFKGFHSE